MKLPLDYVLCDGAGEPICVECLRRTAERPQIHWYMQPPAKDGKCEHYLGMTPPEPQDDGA